MPTKKEDNLSFSDQVREMVKLIPRGQTMSYKEVAATCLNPRAARAVARVMATNFDPKVPCHRVIHHDGRIGDYNRGGSKTKSKLLQTEGCFVKLGHISTDETKW